VLHKGEFVDGYGGPYWIFHGRALRRTVQHALDCQLGACVLYSTMKVRDTLAQVMRDAGHTTVEIEPQLQPLSGEVFEYKSANKDGGAKQY